MILRKDIYIILGLYPRDVFLEKINSYKSFIYGPKVLRGFRDILKTGKSREFEIYQKEFYRQTGRTTENIINTILYEYQGYDIIFCCQNFREEKRIREIWKEYREKIINFYGHPSRIADVKFTTEQKLRNSFRGVNLSSYKLIYDID